MTQIESESTEIAADGSVESIPEYDLPVNNITDAGKDKSNVRCKIIADSTKAILIQMPKGIVGQYWIPLSQISQIHRTFDKLGYDSIIASNWILRTKGLI